ncbi:rhodanese-like domain protein [Desulforapulum autotrophicum HRM2]|uniref:Rhodanese-like domain protein n=1 Tax=Desulforapulum autotrophicum (strain ATCC 43914 / DSM 3382 / VKM B-1955 / HRM2) TaxID=177437 RepID=C0QL90_DESAH|nr:rhodanese-like domain-containing protein [Desulforapulum autotrophicum]ACN14176.1 rhodanese-like domain protein [Desulforapulum autotrophicum HRM2]
MKWKPYLTPIRSFDPDEARAFLNHRPVDQVTLVDVRQPGEYQAGHIPGARLIPLPELVDRLDDIPRNFPVIVYCSSGPRSRAACQLMTLDDSFGEIINLTGGFNAWEGEAALGRENQGLTFFTGAETPREILEIAYGLEQGLREFYLSMDKQVKNPGVRRLFATLARVETLHQESILREYQRIIDPSIKEDQLTAAALQGTLEGGMTTQEYIDYYMPQWEDPEDVVFLAMAIEAQALDLYLRAKTRVVDETSRKILTRIAQEEKSHLVHLGELMDGLISGTAT